MSDARPTSAVPVEPSADLDRLRREIDAVDARILQNLHERARLVQQVGAVKQATGEPVYDAARERDLVASLQRASSGPFPSAAVSAVFREIISGTRSLERALRVAYLGPAGTFSHQAARSVFGACAEFVPVPTIPDIFAAVERGRADQGVVPVENSTEGVVTQTLDAFVDAEVVIQAESQLRICLQLLSRSGRLQDVRRVVSHPQPLAQCRRWLDRSLPGVDRVEVASTVAAARVAAEDAAAAAIAGSLAGEVCGLAAIESGIEDRSDNTTRFVVIGRHEAPPSGNDLTSVVFTVRKAESGALHRLLEPFARHAVNLTSIQSRPIKGKPWEYHFFLDLEGHVAEPRVKAALAEAAERAHSHRVLGSFPRAENAG